MTDMLPTMQAATWSVARFHDVLLSLLKSDRKAMELRLYFYAVTAQGWQLARRPARQWLGRVPGRRLVAYVGTDHGITDADALSAMQSDGVRVRLLLHHVGIYHPKVAWFVRKDGGGLVLVGSNNLSHDGLLYNVEFATVTDLKHRNASLSRWHAGVDRYAADLTTDLLESYRQERESFDSRRAAAKAAASFTWSRRTGSGRRRRVGGGAGRSLGSLRPRDLLLEIMDRETGSGGTQIQIPMSAARPFFGLANRAGAGQQVQLRNKTTGQRRSLRMTRYANHTTRLVIHELDYRDRPCVILFRRQKSGIFAFEIVRESLEPRRYRTLIRQCDAPTRSGSRRWAIA